jgi:3-oxoacyl-[acyl-carrier-protein] synthase III
VPAAILGIAYHLPARVETNDDLARLNPDWDMPRLVEKSGIRQRHIAAPDETAGDLGFLAAERLLGQNLVPTAEIDAILLCTQSPDYFLPTTACVLQNRLKLGKHVAALDFNLGCSGFVYGLYMAKCFIESGAARNVLLITAETYSKFIHPRDRTVKTLFGDGAAATLIGRAEAPGLGQFVLGTDGAGFNDLLVPAGGLRMPRTHHTAQELWTRTAAPAPAKTCTWTARPSSPSPSARCPKPSPSSTTAPA